MMNPSLGSDSTHQLIDGKAKIQIREFLLFKMNALIVQEFFKRFPVYALVPNFLLIGDPTAREVLDSTGDTKSIRDLL